MTNKTRQLTTGAMFTAIFALLLLVDRQTGSAFEELLMFLMPIPMVGFSSGYGFKASLPVWIAMSLISVIFSTPMGIFYAVTESLIGMVIGSRIFAKKDATLTLLISMGLSALANVLNTIVLAVFFGYNLSDSVTEFQEMLQKTMDMVQTNEQTAAAMASIMDPSYLMRILILSTIVLGLLQGFVIFEMSLLILRRLKFQVPAPKSVFLYYPPFWSGLLGFGLFLLSYLTQLQTLSDNVKSIIQMVSLCGYLYLVCIGFIAVMLIVKGLIKGSRSFLPVLIAFALFMILPYLEMLVGFFYTMPVYHDRWLAALNKP